jgi:hypothetical protein
MRTFTQDTILHSTPSEIQKLVQKLRDEDFFDWEEKKQVCVDFPEVNITAIFEGTAQACSGRM